jgi:hypothetical protein
MVKTQTIRCIVKEPRDNPYEAIKFVGGTNSDGSRWKQTQQWAVDGIDSGQWQFDSLGTDGVSAKVVTATSRFGHRYIKTVADRDVPDNLLKLPPCP